MIFLKGRLQFLKDFYITLSQEKRENVLKQNFTKDANNKKNRKFAVFILIKFYAFAGTAKSAGSVEIPKIELGAFELSTVFVV